MRESGDDTPIAERDKRLRDLEKENKRLRDKIRELERIIRELKTTPQHLASSDKTAEAGGVPSSKIYYRRPSQPGPNGTKRRPGGQPGHKGHARQRPEPNQPPVFFTLDRCPVTGQPLDEPADWLERTITDLPTPSVNVHVEHRARYSCPCAERHVAESLLPPYKQWGPNLVAFVAHHRMLTLSVTKIQTLLREDYRLGVSEGAILGMETYVARLLGPRYAEIQAKVRESRYVGGDETKFRVNGENGWLWTFAAIEAVLFEIAPTRGASVPVRVLEGFNGVLGRDAWDPYDQVECEAHQLDPVHINRWLERAEVKNGVEPRPFLKPVDAKVTRPGRPPEELLRFVDGVRRLLRDAVGFVEAKKPPGKRKRATAYASFRRRLKRHLGKPWKHPDADRIANELWARLDQVFTFVRIPGVPWHNNDAELQIRQGVGHRKAAGGRRTWAGAENLARLLSVYRTCKRTGESFSVLIREAYATAAASSSRHPSGTPQT